MAYVKDYDLYIRQKVGPSLPGTGLGNVTLEILGGADGINKIFQLSAPANFLQLYKNGLFMTPGPDYDYVFDGSTITFNEPPGAGAVITALCWRV
ncbi:hypothetical protein MTAT_20480 [Moorella thermoacetica]|uniref:DUF4183 domain-containing protein n=1 Tax=Neomoorella thermoacetica TaxID=1525 RepID=A0AAC9MUE5_NEOTH|nr:hypothetical protein [Moorella thermoacetica]AOQ24703.1 hypothetical protein Maut_02275 [Moorella thermoacetica]TYL12806.1 hypothetical protein MTAT_20480 [Moorella thermoacetica]